MVALPRRHFHRVALHPPGDQRLYVPVQERCGERSHLNIQLHGQAGNRTRDLLQARTQLFRRGGGVQFKLERSSCQQSLKHISLYYTGGALFSSEKLVRPK